MPGVELATAYVSIVTDGSKIAPEVRKQFGTVQRDADRSGKSAGKRFSGGFSGALKPAVAAVGGLFALDKIKDFVGGAISEASDLGESINALNVSYGKSSKGIQRLGQEASRALGLSNVEFNSLAVQFSGFAGTIAGRGGDVVNVLDKLSTRGSDFASVMNLDVSEAMGLFQSGLAGETEPLRKFGIDLSAAAVEAHAYAKGIAAAGEDLTEQQKVQARYSLLMKSTAKTQGDFANTSDSLANSQRILGAEWSNLQAVAGEKLVPVLAELTSTTSDFVTGMQDGTGAGGKFVDIAQDLGDTFKSDVLPVLEDTVDIGRDVVGFFASAPGPVKELALQAGLAAVVLPRMTAALVATRAAAGGFVTNIRDAEKRTAALGSAARTAAGIGGMLALAQGARSTSKEMTVFAGAAGGAALGFSVGGPWGAAIGGAAGLLGGLTKALRSSKDAMSEADRPAADYASSLNEVSGAATRATRAVALQALQQQGAISAANNMGISARDLVSATLGQEGALKRVNKALDAQRGRTVTYVDSLGQWHTTTGLLTKDGEAVARGLGRQSEALADQARDTRAAALATGDLSKVLRGVPKNIATKISQEGDPGKLTAMLERYIRTGKLAPKEIKTIVRATNLAPVGKDIDKFTRQLIKAAKTGEETGPRVNEGLKKAGKARPSNDWLRYLKNDIASGRTAASSGGTGVGSALGAGINAGIGSWMNRISTSAASAVSFAVRAAKKAGKVQSPSKETRYIGKMLSLGLSKGMDDGRKGAGLSAERLMKVVDKAIDRKGISKARAKEMSKVVREVNKALGKLEKRYETHYEKLKQLRSDRESMIASTAGALTGELDLSAAVSENEYGFGGQATFASVAAVITGLKSRISQTVTLMKQALGAGIPRGLVQEVLGMGTAQAIPVFKALLSGSKAQRTSLAGDYAAIGTYANQAGVVLGDAFYASGIAAQKGLLKGLLDDKAIDKAAKKLSDKLTKAVKKALGIKSPSKRMHDEVGLDSGRGIGEGALAGLDPYPSKIADTLAATEARRVAVASPVLTPDAAASGNVMTAPDLLDRMTLNVTLVPTGRQKAQLYIDGKLQAERYL